MITGAVYLAALPMKETYKPEILRRRAKRLGIKPVGTGMAKHISAKKSVMQGLVRPLHMLVTEVSSSFPRTLGFPVPNDSQPAVFFFSLYTAFAFGVIFLFFAAFPFVFERSPYNFSTSEAGLAFIAIGIGVLIGGFTGVVVDRVWYQKKARAAVQEGRQYAAPEHRLYNAMLGSFGLPIGMFWFGWTADKGVHWAVPLVGAIPFAWGNICVFVSSMEISMMTHSLILDQISAVLYMADVYGPSNGASALAANGIVRYVLGGVFPLFTIQSMFLL